MPAESVESVLSREGRPMTAGELQTALPQRKRIYEALQAAIKMGYVRRITRGGYSTLDAWQYEYIPAEQRSKR